MKGGKTRAACASLGALLLLTGCSSAGGGSSTDPEALEADRQMYDMQTEADTFLYENETETDFFGEMLMRSIWNVYSADTREWAEGFRSSSVSALTYTTYMEDEPQDFRVTDKELIEAVFAAIDVIEVADSLPYPGANGDVFTFEMKDGSLQTFAFSMGCVKTDGSVYETDGTDMLWELTAGIIYGSEEAMTEY